MVESRFLLELKLLLSLSLHNPMNSLWKETISALSVFSSHPLFSCIVTFCTLVFLYLPHLFWKIVFSPVLILTWVLLFSILRLGATQKSQQTENRENSEPIVIANQENRGSKTEEQSSSPIEQKETEPFDQVHQWVDSQVGFDSSSCFVEWNVKAPLEVIYEEYEGEEEAGEDPNEKEENRNMGIIHKYSSFSRYYPEPESDSDSSSENGFLGMEDWDSSEKFCFRWDDEEEREGLIEIALDGCLKKNKAFDFHFEEENLIEIDISPTRYKELSGEDDVFSGGISCH